MFNHKTTILTAVLIALAAAPALAQDEVLQEKKAPRRLDSVHEFDPSTAEIKAWGDAYRKDKEPRILVLCGIDRRSMQMILTDKEIRVNGGIRVEEKVTVKPGEATYHGSAQNAAATAVQKQQEMLGPQGGAGGVAKGAGNGGDLSLFDPTGVADPLRAEVMNWLRKDATGVQLVDLASLEEQDRREVEIAAQNKEDAAVKLAGTKLNAELVYYIKLQPVADGFKCVFELRDLRSARLIHSRGTDWGGSTDNRQIQRFAAWFAREAMRGYTQNIAATGGVTKYNVVILGLKSDRQANEAKRAVTEIKGVGTVKLVGFTPNTEGSRTSMEIRFDGDSADLSVALQETLEKKLQISLASQDTQGGSLMLKAGAK